MADESNRVPSTENINATVRRALAANGYRTDGFRVITDRRKIATDVHCPGSLNSELRSMFAEWFPHAIVEPRSDRVHIIW